MQPVHIPIPDDWTEMSNAELNGSQIPGSVDEKIRRSIEALYDYNEGRSHSEQWSITLDRGSEAVRFKREPSEGLSSETSQSRAATGAVQPGLRLPAEQREGSSVRVSTVAC